MASIASHKIKQVCACGASGCAIYPGLICDSQIKSDKNKPSITKIFWDKKIFEEEMKIYDKDAKKLNKIDKEEKYFISTYSRCTEKYTMDDMLPACKGKMDIKEKGLTSKEREREKVNDRNAFVMKQEIKFDDWMNNSSGKRVESRESAKIEEFNAINLSYLGESMSKILEGLNPIDGKISNRIDKIINFLDSIKNIFSGISLLNSNDIYHCDIKPDNLVAVKNSETQILSPFKMIDFGNAIFGKDVEKIGKLNQEKTGEVVTGYTRGYISPEYFYCLFTDIPYRRQFIFGDDGEKYSRENNDLVFNLETYHKTTDNQLERKHTVSKIPMIPDSYYEILEEEDIKNKTNKLYIKNDIWSMGYVLKEICDKFYKIYEHAKNETEKEFLADVISGLGEVITKLLVLDVDERPDASAALVIYTKFIESITGQERGTHKAATRRRTHRILRLPSYNPRTTSIGGRRKRKTKKLTRTRRRKMSRKRL
jgi:hypothetical protein